MLRSACVLKGVKIYRRPAIFPFLVADAAHLSVTSIVKPPQHYAQGLWPLVTLAFLGCCMLAGLSCSLVSACAHAEGQAIHSEGPHEEPDSVDELEEVVGNLKEQCASVRLRLDSEATFNKPFCR